MIDGEVHCTRVPYDDGKGRTLVLTPGHVRASLGPEIDEVRQTRRAKILSADAVRERGIGNLHVLLRPSKNHAKRRRSLLPCATVNSRCSERAT